MAYDIVPSLWRFPHVPSIWEDDDTMTSFSAPTGLSISEDEKNVYVEAALPGVAPKNVEITFDKGMLWIKGEAQAEESKKKYYRKATSSFSYRVAVPGEIDQTVEPEAISTHGIMTVRFSKSPASQPKKISVKV